MKRKLILCLLMFLGTSAVTLRAQFLTLHSFDYTDGGTPYAGVYLAGTTLFGTTSSGGGPGNGNVFQVNTDGSGFVDLLDFTNTQVSFTRAGFVVSGSTLYGPGYQGGPDSDGVVYAINMSGAGYTNLHVFTGGTDDSDPRGGLVLSSNVLYGTTQYQSGGTGNGEVFAVNTDGSGFATLHPFAGTDGSQPYGSLLLANNVLYGTTYSGGASNLGEVFSLTTDGKTFALLHSFTNLDGTHPAAGLVLSGATLYGTASTGGSVGDGTIFSIGTNGLGFTVVHSFTNGNGDGATPLASLLVSSNLLYGTTSAGGGGSSAGTVFSISTNGTNLNLLHIFTGGNDGGNPGAALVLGGKALYGTTVNGGTGGNGTVFGLELAGVVIASQPTPQTNLSGGAGASFFYSGFSITGRPMQYQWRINGVNIPGQTSYELQYSSVVPTNGGTVTVAVSDGVTAPNSTPALFSVATAINATNNDFFTNRYQLAATSSGIVSSSNTLATRENGEPVILAGNPGGKSIWFKWKPPASGVAVFDTIGSAFDTMMGVYNGTTLATLVREPSAVSDDDSGGYLTSKVSFNAVANQEYEIVVDGYWGASGNVVLSWQMPGGPPTQLPALLITPPPLTVGAPGALVNLTCVANTGVPTWFSNGVSTGFTGTNLVVGPLSAANVGTYVAQFSTGTGIVSSQPARVEINTLQDGSTQTSSAAFDKFLDSSSSPFVQPSITGLQRLGGGDTHGYSVSQTFSTVGASGEPNEPNIAGQIGGAPAWYVYVTPTNGTFTVNTAGSTFNTLLAVFTGPGNTFATLTDVADGYTTNYVLNGQPQVMLTNVPKGQTNFIVVDGYQGTSGVVQLNISLGTPVAIPVIVPSSQFVVAGTNANLSASATGSTPVNYYWFHAGTNIAWATNANITITNVQAGTSGAYTVLASNLVSVASNSATLTLGTKPVVTTQPISHTITTNTTASLSVVANGNPTPAYQWLFNGTDTGTNGSALGVLNFTTTNQGTYSVLVSNVLGVTPSSNAVLMLNAPYQLAAPSLSAGQFQLQIVGISGTNYVLQASTNLTNWISLVTNNSATGFISLTDTNATNFKARYYRALTN